MNGDVIDLLTSGEMTLLGRIPSASNLTLACVVRAGDDELRCVYKPVRGEAPLWDFPDGTLAGREVASYLICEALGWDLIPETTLRQSGPVDADLGPGMVQRWIDGPESDLIDVVRADAVSPGSLVILAGHDADGTPVALVHRDDARLARLAVLDAVINNADRKGGHVLTTADGRMYGIDHGICLHAEDKLRTVLWGWAGRPIADDDLAALGVLHSLLAQPDAELVVALAALISGDEIEALRIRVGDLLDSRRMPSPPHSRAIPWPPF
ncbi:SCO1664 family protein [Gordonia shandongensis]|uniref:SCO1664 family protein n=1 Tax=Gordonia shandongensis TaxID=376351 RepID=UPI00040F0B29|nr:SCO1664 family protein [Gordonia shandongensis]